MNLFLSFYYLIKWFFHEDLSFVLVFVLSSFYRRLVCRRFIDVMLFVVLLQQFICVGAIQTGKSNLISRIYQIMVISILKNWCYRYSSHYFIKFVGFIPIYYAINLNIVLLCMVFSYLYLSCMVFSYLYLGSIALLQV